MPKKLIVLAGPTAVGKTALSIELARHFGCPIISGDSRQFYKEISIGTAKPTATEKAEVEHYFVDSHSIHEPLSAGQFEREAIPIINELFKSHNHLILTGGSGLFLKAIYDGLDQFVTVSQEVKDQVIQLEETEGLKGLQDKLEEIDPVYFKDVDQRNRVRLTRAIEVCLEAKKPYSSFLDQAKSKRSFETVKIMLNRDRKVLYNRINLRVDIMMKNGLMEEVQSVYPYKELKSLQTVGYNEIFDLIDKKHDLTTTIELIKRNTRRYAKRQLTWFKREGFEWFEPEQIKEIISFLETPY
jgi:tRNA dimethylallyltransferase